MLEAAAEPCWKRACSPPSTTVTSRFPAATRQLTRLLFRCVKTAPSPTCASILPESTRPRFGSSLSPSEPLITRRMPNNERAGELYSRAVERALEKSIATRKSRWASSVDLATRRMETTLVLANPPKVSDVRFEGAHALSAAALRDAVRRHRDRQSVLGARVPPGARSECALLYEERGYLKVDFPSIRLTQSGR